MKTQMWKLRKSAALAAASLMMIFMAAACGNKDGGAPPPVPPPIVYPPGVTGPACTVTGCASGGSFLTSTYGQYYGSDNFAVGFDFFATSAVQQTVAYGTYYSTVYAGPMVAQGAIYVNSLLVSCQVPPGVYQVQSQQPGSFGADGAGRSVQFYATAVGGPVPLNIVVSGYVSPASPPVRSPDGRTFPTAFSGQVTIQRTDGTAYPCQFQF
jgi:hypothetical protein